MQDAFGILGHSVPGCVLRPATKMVRNGRYIERKDVHLLLPPMGHKISQAAEFWKRINRKSEQFLMNNAYIVLFPEPLAPTTAIYDPALACRVRLRRTGTVGRVGYRKRTFSSRTWPLVILESRIRPVVESASISGTESRRRMMSEPALLADDMSGTNVKMFPD